MNSISRPQAFRHVGLQGVKSDLLPGRTLFNMLEEADSFHLTEDDPSERHAAVKLRRHVSVGAFERILK